MTQINAKRVRNSDSSNPTASPANSTRRRTTRKAQPVEPSPVATSPTVKLTKREQLAAMLLRDEGATLNQMIGAMGWLPHTTRAALTGLRKTGYAIDSDKVDGVRTYRAVASK